ncbi:MAG: MBL fold metallo-hydrolase [Acidobacteriota bacterium]
MGFIGPKRWYDPPLPLDELPEVDAVVISHDHYDPLDYETVTALMKRGSMKWIVSLGVGAHLEYWGVDPSSLVELDWWEETETKGVTFTATPARHCSGRLYPSLNGGKTLWSGWSIAGNTHRVYFSGDTGFFDELVEIGERLGPFDLTLIEVGAYSSPARDVHLGPEQGVRAHQLVRGKVMLPVHWGLFGLNAHGWTEPAERVLVAAANNGVTALSIRPG